MRCICISSELRASLLAKLRAAYPREGCGALLGCEDDRGCLEITAIEALPNAEALRGEDRFVVDPRAYAELERRWNGRSCLPQDPHRWGRHSCLPKNGAQLTSAQHPRVLGFFHSHPNGVPRPSSVDLECAAGLFEFARIHYVYAIAALEAAGTAELSFWELDAAAKAFVPSVVQLSTPAAS